MSIKKEIYYKFIFPTYESLSGSDSDPIPTSDGVDQIGEVRALCRECPERVITYDKLDSTLKSYVDTWVSIPKYFNLRNYWDANPCQEGGMSLIVSHTPENLGNSWTKFKVGTKTIYCSLVISSGDFFYGFTLPDEVIEKSGLRNEIVKPTQYVGNGSKTPLLRFHSNWCLNTKERYEDEYNDTLRAQTGQEKRVFVQHYFSDGFNYGGQNPYPFYYVNFLDDKTDTVYDPLGANIHCKDITGSYKDEYGYTYTGSNKNLPPKDYVEYYYADDNESNHLTVQTYNSADFANLPDDVKGKTREMKVVEHASDYAEDLKYDFIDLEATRRILFYGDGLRLFYGNSYRDIHPIRDIPRIVGGTKTGTDTVLSYEPPDEYVNAEYTFTYNNYSLDNTLNVTATGTPPLQIPYNLLRYCLNDRPPFSDCETVLVMWVADSDPNNVVDGDVAALHGLNWQQYAIPISCRCCFKENDTCNTDRFLVLYPHGATGEAKDEYAFHFRRTDKYDGTFKEALYLQDLIRYSNDYIISLRYKSLEANFIQRYLFENARSSFKELYVRKGYEYTNREKQFYYVKVDKSLYDIDTNIETCFVKPGTTTQFEPSTALEDKYQDWDLDKEDWVIRDDWFIALFATNNTAISTSTGKLTLIDSPDLKSKLISIDGRHSWEDIYLSSLGISPYSQIDHDFMKLSGSISGDTVMLPLDVLDGHIQIGNTRYGSTINNKVVIGFKDVFDYTNDDCHHFYYDSDTDSYILTKNQDYLYTAYVMSSM